VRQLHHASEPISDANFLILHSKSLQKAPKNTTIWILYCHLKRRRREFYSILLDFPCNFR
jgi:hypothetical protein